MALRRVDRQTMKVYIYIVGSSKNSKRSIISAASGSTGLFYFLANDPDFRRSKFRNCYGIQAARARFLETKISSPVSSFYSFFFEGRKFDFSSIEEKKRFFGRRESLVFFPSRHTAVSSAQRCNNVAAQRDSLFYAIINPSHGSCERRVVDSNSII